VWAVLSDVHGNLEALERALATCRALGASRFAFLGDLLGRGDSDGCVRLIRAVAAVSVQGNRDRDWAPRVSAPARAYVLALPVVACADGFACAHGDPRLHRPLDVSDIRRGALRTYSWLRSQGLRLGFYGHTHQARVWRKRGPNAPLEDVTAAAVPLDDDEQTIYLANVGTVGLPFPGKGPPSCTLYDGQRLHLVQL
jgi:predicted phosphodiesterase